MYIGLDVGTSAVKGVLVDERLGVRRVASCGLELSMPRPGWTEQSPADWWAASKRVLAELTAAAREVGGAGIGGVGLSGQMHGSVFLDRAALDAAGGAEIDAVRPALLWNDQRTARECEEIESAVGGRAALVQAAGNAALTGFTLPKVLWLRRHEPEAFERTALVMNPKDFVRLCLTGEAAAEVGDAAGCLCLDVERRRWSHAVLDAVGLDPGLFAGRLLESAGIAGRVTRWASEQTGLPAGACVVAGSGDNQCGAAGAGVVSPGRVLATLGTSGVVYAHSTAARRDLDGETPGRVHTMCAADGTDAAPGHWCITGCTLSAAGSLAWARRTLGPDAGYDALLAEAAGVPAGSEGLIFLPYLTGERCPHPDPAARGAWIGLSGRHTRGHLIRAVLEGVAMTMGEILDIVRSLGVPAESARLGGGGNRSPLWRQIQADVYGLPVSLPEQDEGPAFGAAVLAAVGGGGLGSVNDAQSVVRDTETREPSERAAVYAELRPLFSRAYNDTAALAHGLTAAASRP